MIFRGITKSHYYYINPLTGFSVAIGFAAILILLLFIKMKLEEKANGSF